MNLDVDSPDKVAVALRKAAEMYRDSEIDLQATWQDSHAGRVWRELAKILERAASACDKACETYWK